MCFRLKAEATDRYFRLKAEATDRYFRLKAEATDRYSVGSILRGIDALWDRYSVASTFRWKIQRFNLR